MRKRRKPPPKPVAPQPRINERIRVPEVRLIDEEGQQVGIVATAEALTMARQRQVDLVEVAAQARPPVARLMDYGRFKYEQSKKEREAKKLQTTSELREVRMKAKIDNHDIDFKTRTAQKLLLRGDKVKVSVMFRGREITHPQIGRRLLERVVESLDPIAAIEKPASLEGRMMTTILVPDKKKIAARKRAEAAAAANPDAPSTPVEEVDDDLDNVFDQSDDLEELLRGAAEDDDDGDDDDFDESDDDAESESEPVTGEADSEPEGAARKGDLPDTA